MMSPGQTADDRHSSLYRHTPLQILHVIGNFMRIWSVYSMYNYLSQSGASVVLFIFSCLVPSSILLLVLQKPWKGRPLSNQQVIPSMINGAITALYFILWVKGVRSCGPLRAILAEYSGAVLGVLSAALYGRRGHIWKKVGGLLAMLASFYLLSQGWSTATSSPFYILAEFFLLNFLSFFPPHPFLWVEVEEEYSRSYPTGIYDVLNHFLPSRETIASDIKKETVTGMKEMGAPIFAGVLSALRRVIARRVSLKNQLKKRLHVITIASATCFMFPVAMWDVILGTTPDSGRELPFSTWPYLSTILFGIILIFYIEILAEERLHMVFSSPRHLMVAGGCIIVMEIIYKMDFSLVGFLICCAVLGFGIHEATSLGRPRKDSSRTEDLSEGALEDQIQMSSLPT